MTEPELERLSVHRLAIDGGEERPWTWSVETVGRKISGSAPSFDKALELARQVAEAHGLGR